MPALGDFILGDFLDHWAGHIRHDLSASESTPLELAELLAHATPPLLDRWTHLRLGYADPRGAIWLREAIAARYGGIGIGADGILSCAGAQEGLRCAIGAVLRPEDHAILILPVYQPSADAVVTACRVSAVALEFGGGGWFLDLDRVAAAIRPETRAIIANFPNSPTGAVLAPDDLAALVALARRHGLWLIDDEVYRLTAETISPPICLAYERGISVDSLSKGIGLPGLRVGWIACSDRAVVARAARIKSSLSGSLAAPNEVLAAIALHAADTVIARNRLVGRENLRRLRAIMARHPERFAPLPCGNLAFASPRFLGGEGVDAFADRLAREAGILVLPWRLWHSDLAALPSDHLRVGLGQWHHRAGLAALGRYLDDPARYQRSSRGPETSPSRLERTTPSEYQTSTKQAETSGQCSA